MSPITIGVVIDDQLRTTTNDVARLWFHPEGRTDEITLSVLVRCVSNHSSMHDQLVVDMCEALRAAIKTIIEKKRQCPSVPVDSGQPQEPAR